MRLTENIKFILDNLNTTSSECIHFPGAKLKGGYGICQIDGIKTTAHRLAYMHRHQIFDIPTEMDIAHLCDADDKFKQRSCINPNHLELQTPKKNNEERTKLSGELNHKAKMTVAKVIEARYLFSIGYKSSFLADKYKISRPTMSDILKGKAWKNIKGKIL